MDRHQRLFLCLFTILYYIIVTHGMHGHNDRRVTTARIRSRVRIRNFPSTRNSVGRNFEVVRPNFSVYHRQPSRRFRASHIPVRNPYSRGVQSQIIRNANIRSTWPTIPVHSNEPVRRPSMLSQTTRRRLVVDTAKNPFSAAHTGNSINGIRHKNVITQTNKNPLLELLEERRPVLRDEKDAFLIRTHLIELNRLSNSELTNMDRRLQKQVNYIEGILDTDIRREVLKLFVKDIVEKSGFLDMDPNRVRISSLQLLVDKIKMITDKFTNMEKATDQTGSHETPALSGTSGSTPGPDLFQTTTVRDNARQEAILRGKISAALSVYDRSGHQLDTRVVDSNGDLRNLQTYRGRLGAGSSIFGGSDIPTSTVQSVTKGVKREIINAEPVGGDGAYWTHLRSGLVDMLCNLCQHHGVQSCIIRYCNNDVLTSSASRTQSEQTVVEITTPSTLWS